MRRSSMLVTVPNLILATLLAFALACGTGEPTPPDPSPTPDIQANCGFLDGPFSAPLEAATCTHSPQVCADFLNACLENYDYLNEGALWVLRAPHGAVRVSTTDASSIRALASAQGTTPMHGRFNTVFLNPIAGEAFNQQILRDPQGNFDTASLPYGSVIVKHNFTSQTAPTSPEGIKLEGEPWLTVMAKIEGYCSETIGGNCVGGEWFYYLYRFGNFKQFNQVPVYGKPQAFCTDCHNPVAKADFIWNLHLYVRGREQATFNDGTAPAGGPVNTPLPPSALCAEGALNPGPQPPADVPYAPATIPKGDRQDMFDCFSWRTFAALNWPAQDGQRGIPDVNATLADLQPSRVWETYKETAEVFQPQNASWTIDDQAWDDNQFVPEVCQSHLGGLANAERAKVLQMITKTRSHQILNETHQAMGNQFNILVDQSGKLVQYEVRFNRDEFEYLKANGFANTGSYSFEGPKDAEVYFPTNANGETGMGATETKASWRELCSPGDGGTCTEEEEATAARYYTQTSLIYTPKTRQSKESCRLAKTGLVGLHIIRKTQHAPQWVWSTFEHRDNVPPAGQPGKAGTDYLLYDDTCEGKTPSVAFCSTMRPGVIPFATDPNKDCCPNAQLIINANPGKPNANGTLQATGTEPLINNQVTRLVPVGPVAMNARFQAALPAPWNQYFLVNTQWPSGARQVVGEPSPGAARRIPCNVRDLLWLDQGGKPSAFVEAGIPKPSCFTMKPDAATGGGELKLRNTTMETYQTAWNNPTTPSATQVSVQSCFNCHGFSGVDFSFLWTDGAEEVIPFPPPQPVGSEGP